MENTGSVTAALTDALGTVSADMMGAISGVLPIALTILGAVLVVTIGIKVFKRFSK